jgi:DNA-binding XRE family transcriptional regulator
MKNNYEETMKIALKLQQVLLKIEQLWQENKQN